MNGQDKRCPVCKGAVTQTNEIVTCPNCGAPHHRACYDRTGECFFAPRHSESNDWHTFAEDAPDKDTTPCSVCGYQNDWSAFFCFRCGESLVHENRTVHANPRAAESGGGQMPFAGMNLSSVMDPYAGLNPNEKIGEHTVEEWAAFIGPNSFYYLPRFREIEEGRKDFNYSGAFLNTFWCFFRDMKLPGIVFMMVMVLCNFLNTYMSDYFERNNYAHSYIVVSVLLILLLGGTMFFCGFWANWGYKKFCDKRIRTIKQIVPTDLLNALRTQGGIRTRNAYTAFAVFVVVNFIGTLLIGMR